MSAAEKIISAAEAKSLFSDLQSFPVLLLAVSGGPDSTALLWLAARWRDALKAPPKLIAITIDHGLRKESKAEAAAVARLTRQLKVAHRTLHWRGKKPASGLQQAARAARYRLLSDAAQKFGAAHILTAHTLDDQAETVLMRLIRGSGRKGLSGIPPVSNGVIIRPLIETPRREIEKYLVSNGIKWIEDSTNKLRTIHRNRIRLDLLPELEKYNPKIKETLSRTSDLLRIEEDYIDREAKKYFRRIFTPGESELKGDLRKFRRLHQALRLSVLRLAIQGLEKGLKNITSLHIMAADVFLTSDAASGEIEFPDEMVIAKGYDSFLVTARSGLERRFSYVIASPGKWSFPGFEVDIEKVSAGTLEEEREDVVYLDAGKIGFPIEVRGFRAGDRFIPLGMKDEKKLKNFFVDEKIPRFERYRVPIFTTGGEIFWIGGMRIDERFKVRKIGKKALKLSIRIQ